MIGQIELRPVILFRFSRETFRGSRGQRTTTALRRGRHTLVRTLGPANIKKLLTGGRHPSQIWRPCPHCSKRGKDATMLRWHFDRCRVARQVISITGRQDLNGITTGFLPTLAKNKQSSLSDYKSPYSSSSMTSSPQFSSSSGSSQSSSSSGSSQSSSSSGQRSRKRKCCELVYLHKNPPNLFLGDVVLVNQLGNQSLGHFPTDIEFFPPIVASTH